MVSEIMSVFLSVQMKAALSSFWHFEKPEIHFDFLSICLWFFLLLILIWNIINLLIIIHYVWLKFPCSSWVLFSQMQQLESYFACIWFQASKCSWSHFNLHWMLYLKKKKNLLKPFLLLIKCSGFWQIAEF